MLHPSAKTGRWKVEVCYGPNIGDLLGTIKWHAPWRRYCFFPESDTIFEITCLNDITDFICAISRRIPKKT